MDAHVCSGPPEPSARTNGFKRPYPIVGRSVYEGQLFAMSVKGSRRSIRRHPSIPPKDRQWLPSFKGEP